MEGLRLNQRPRKTWLVLRRPVEPTTPKPDIGCALQGSNAKRLAARLRLGDFCFWFIRGQSIQRPYVCIASHRC